MPRRRKALLILALGLFVCGVIALLTREREPTYEGRPLSEWVARYGAAHTSGSPKPTEAIRHIGTSALPHLVGWLDYQPRSWRYTSGLITEKLPNWVRENRVVKWVLSRGRPNTEPDNVVDAFKDLGPIAAPAIPALARLVDRTEHPMTKVRAIIIMAFIGPDGQSAVLKLLSSPARADGVLSRGLVRELGTNAQPLVPLLVQRLQHTNEEAAIDSAQSLGDLELEPDLVVPALAKTLKDSRTRIRMQAPFTLVQFAQYARSALPALTNALSDPESLVRNSASNAIFRINSNTLTNAPAQ